MFVSLKSGKTSSPHPTPVRGEFLLGPPVLKSLLGGEICGGTVLEKITSQFEHRPELSDYLIILRGMFPKERHLKMHRGYKALG